MERIRITNTSEAVTEVMFQPGNGTRYELVIARMLNDDYAVSWITSSRRGLCCAAVGAHGILHWSYAKEKFGHGGKDLCAIMTAIHEVTGVEVGMEPGYDKNCNYVG